MIFLIRMLTEDRKSEYVIYYLIHSIYKNTGFLNRIIKLNKNIFIVKLLTVCLKFFNIYLHKKI